MSDRKPTPAAVLAKTLRTADALPAPNAIARRIMQSSTGAHNGLRAASYDGKVRGGAAASHPERVSEQRQHANHATELDHLRRLSKASERFVVAIATLVVEVADADPGDMDDYTWSDALKDAHLLAQLDGGERLQAAIDVGRNVTGPIDRAWGAVTDIRAIHERYTPHEATRWEQIRQSGLRADEICDTCASVTPPVYVAVRNRKRLACRHCNDLWTIAGEKPPRDVIQAHHHGTQLEYRKALSGWDAWVRGSRRSQITHCG